jgi:hypothetical protein
MISQIVTIIFCICLPWAIYFFRDFLQSKLKIDYILLAYGSGMLLKLSTQNFFSTDILQGFIYVSIPLAMPLLIFKADFFICCS